MALISCMECGHAVSSRAHLCPACGCPRTGGDADSSNGADAAGVAAAARPADDDTRPTCRCFRCGTIGAPGARHCAHCGLLFPALASATPPPVPPFFSSAAGAGAVATVRDADATIERIAEYERISAILWLCLGILQVVSVVAIIAGLWNIFAAVTRFKLPALIRARDPSIPQVYEGIGQLIVLAIVNVVLGGVIGVAFVVFDFYVRSLILENRGLFASEEAPAGDG